MSVQSTTEGLFFAEGYMQISHPELKRNQC